MKLKWEQRFSSIFSGEHYFTLYVLRVLVWTELTAFCRDINVCD